ncbi:hypothetical protein [Streptomyces bullii]|uniref:Uncharacterized protein n=1 Tax=Streptomyces bullii TaxID=349910 RepID=A0ABW0UQT9_9ACTN
MHSSIAHTEPMPWQPTFVPPLDIAREQARRVLDEANALDTSLASELAVYGTFGALQESLRQVLAALDAEDGRHA